MKKILKAIGVILLVLIALFLIIPLFISKEFHVERSIEINVNQSTAANYLKNLTHFPVWSPWSDIDPNMKYSEAGTPGELGSSYTWSGNDSVGEGKMVITSFNIDSINIDLTFIKPWKSENKIQFNLSSKGNATKVTWSFDGSFSYPTNIMKLFMDMDSQLGCDFEKGLKKLKVALENLPKKNQSSYEIKEIELSPRTYIGKRAVVRFAEISNFYTQNLGAIFQVIQDKKLTMSGAPSGLFFVYDEQKGETDMAAAIPVLENNSTIEGYENWTISGKALKIAYYGDYNKMEAAHDAMKTYMKSHNLKMQTPGIEEYVTDPTTEKDTSKWLTNIYYLVK